MRSVQSIMHSKYCAHNVLQPAILCTFHFTHLLELHTVRVLLTYCRVHHSHNACFQNTWERMGDQNYKCMFTNYNLACTFCTFHFTHLALRDSLLFNWSKPLPPPQNLPLVKGKCPWILTVFIFVVGIKIVLREICLSQKTNWDTENISVLIFL